ncbi:hypothetical protein DER46DRAFT_664595 [Fusarium sp. MPI-SDFR-AT-0072]|nr:hypothetical protein DER46DRAFT_664595 [Fusarium sp. MPI-SDFR-AT-0072]
MTTAAINPEFSEQAFNHILDQFSQGEYWETHSLLIPGYDIPTDSSFPNLSLIELSPSTSPAEPCKTDQSTSYFTNRIGDKAFHIQTDHMLGPGSSMKRAAPDWSDVDETTILARPFAPESPKSIDMKESGKSNSMFIKDTPQTSQEAKMRSASRKPKKVQTKPQLPLNILQARESHNNVEKKYRTRLKLRFERLLAVLQASKLKSEGVAKGESEEPEYCYSRGEVLDAARQHILTLEEENKRLTMQLKELTRGLIST